MSAPRYFEWVSNHFSSEFVDEGELEGFSPETIADVLAFQSTHVKYRPTPLRSLDGLARHLNVSRVLVKDESLRFDLNAFKIMGGIYAVGKYIADLIGRPMTGLTFDDLRSPAVRRETGDLTFISATDGNHGRGIAWAARELGYKSVIHMPKGTTRERFYAIAKEGASCKITDVNYDETIRLCKALASEHGWVMVQDTSWEGYKEIPLWISQGYAAIAKEIMDELEARGDGLPTHVFLQAGVGSFAAGVAAYILNSYIGKRPPKIIVTEPKAADCYYRSLSTTTGAITPVTGEMNSIMAGLCCGEPSIDSYRLLRKYAAASFSCADQLTALGMRVLGNPLPMDERVISGESGAITTGLLTHLRSGDHEDVCRQLGLDSRSSVLLISTEGNTDEKSYRNIVWNGNYNI